MLTSLAPKDYCFWHFVKTKLEIDCSKQVNLNLIYLVDHCSISLVSRDIYAGCTLYELLRRELSC